jgi:Putative Flp pilus-assembly TadE/G-like
VKKQPAQVVVWVAVMIPMLFLPIIGLSIDAGTVFDARRDLQDIADGAARSGGMQIDVARLQGLNPSDASQDGQLRLDRGKARQAAKDYLMRFGSSASEADNDVTFNGDREIIVTPWRDVQPTFLKLLRVGAVRVHATGVAEPCSGVVTGTCAGP